MVTSEGTPGSDIGHPVIINQYEEPHLTKKAKKP
jgi:hypothetical protein